MKLVVYLSCVLSMFSQSYASEMEVHETVDSVIEAFQVSIVQNDKERFLSLFVDPAKPMIAVVDEHGYQARKAITKKYNEEKGANLVATRTFTMTPIKAAERKTTRKSASQQKITNVKTISDGNIASIYFDYAYFVGGKMNNKGKETWQLVNTVKGWKIAGVVYSIESKK